MSHYVRAFQALVLELQGSGSARGGRGVGFCCPRPPPTLALGYLMHSREPLLGVPARERAVHAYSTPWLKLPLAHLWEQLQRLSLDFQTCHPSSTAGTQAHDHAVCPGAATTPCTASSAHHMREMTSSWSPLGDMHSSQALHAPSSPSPPQQICKAQSGGPCDVGALHTIIS